MLKLIFLLYVLNIRSDTSCPSEILSSVGVTLIFYFRFYSLLSLLAIIVTENVIIGNFHFRFTLGIYTIAIHRETPILLVPSYTDVLLYRRYTTQSIPISGLKPNDRIFPR